MNKHSLKKQIAKKLDQLSKLLDKTDEARIIEPDDSETWDNDTLYNLKESCQQIIQLLEDKKDTKQKDEFGDPVILETGICSLIEEYNSDEESDDEE